MLCIAKRHGIRVLDTACTYGEAETRLGDQGAASQGFQIVTKTPPIKSDEIREEDIALVSTAFLESLRRLQCKQVYGLMVHHADNLLLPGGDRLWAVMQYLKAHGQVGKIGVSVYHPEQLERILERYDIDLVQLPFNIYDQRFANSGMLRQLRESGVEIHSRSAFLQGLLLLSPEKLPKHFQRIGEAHARLHQRFREAGLAPREACLHFCLDHAEIDRVVVGCETTRQLSEIIDSAEKADRVFPWAESCAVDDESIINPSRWPG